MWNALWESLLIIWFYEVSFWKRFRSVMVFRCFYYLKPHDGITKRKWKQKQNQKCSIFISYNIKLNPVRERTSKFRTRYRKSNDETYCIEFCAHTINIMFTCYPSIFDKNWISKFTILRLFLRLRLFCCVCLLHCISHAMHTTNFVQSFFFFVDDYCINFTCS